MKAKRPFTSGLLLRQLLIGGMTVVDLKPRVN
jgi:hypothetical protein